MSNQICGCGNVFMADAEFCRKCGSKREDRNEAEAAGPPGVQSLGSMELVHAFGIYPAAIRDAVISLGDDAVLFVVGRHLAVWDHARKKLEFLQRQQENAVVTAAAKSSNGRLLAVAEQQGSCDSNSRDGHVRISIISLPSGDTKESTKKVLQPANKRSRIVDLAFTQDGKHLVSISGMPETTITYWKWEASKVVSTHDLQRPINRLQVNPTNNLQLSLSGPSYMRLWDLNQNDYQLRENASVFPLKKEKEADIVDHCWVGEEGFLCAATRDGHVHLFEENEPRQDIDVREIIEKDESTGPKALEREQAKLLANMMGGGGPTAAAEPPPVCLVSVAPWGRGFVVGGDQGYLGVFKVDSKAQSEPFGTFRIPGEDSHLWSMSASAEDTHLTILSFTEQDAESDPAKTGGVPKGYKSGSGSQTVSRTGTAGGNRSRGRDDPPLPEPVEDDKEKCWSLCTFPVSQADLATTGQMEIFTPVVPMGVHHGAITSMATCDMRRVIATCGTDMRLKIWNYPSENMFGQASCYTSEMSVKVSTYEKPRRMAMHPFGFQVAVVLDDMLRIYHLTTQQATRTLFDLPLKHPGDVAYSNSGSLLAVTSNNDVICIDPWKGLLVRNFSGSGGHLSIVNQVRFSQDDKLLLSCSASPSGAIYGWNMDSEDKARTFEHVSKGTDYASFDYDFRRKMACAIARVDGSPGGGIRMIKKDLSAQHVELLSDPNGPVYTAVALACPLKLMFAGMQNGAIRTFAWPIWEGGLENNPYTEIGLHAHPITSLALSGNAQLLFSGCKGGAMMTCEVKTGRMEDSAPCRIGGGIMDSRFSKFRNFEDGTSKRKSNREEERKAEDIQKKLTEAKGSMAHNVASLDDMVMLPRNYFTELLAEIKQLEEQMASLRHESDYALEQKDIEIQEKLEQLKQERKHERQQHDEKYDSLFTQHKRALERHKDEVDKANGDFEGRARSQQDHFEGNIGKERDVQDRLLHELHSLKEQQAKRVEAIEEKNAKQLKELRDSNESALREWRTEYDKVCSLLKSDGVKFEEALRQQETEYEDQISEILELKRSVLQVESEKSTTALKDGVSMKQTITMLQGTINEIKNKLEDSESKRKDKEKELEASKEMFANVQEQLREEKRALKVKGESLAKIREQMKHLESFRFVLFHKVKQMEKERDPLAEQVSSLKNSVSEMYSEFVREFRHKQKLDQQLNDKTNLSVSLQQENVMVNRQLIQLKKDARKMLNEVEKILHAETNKEFEQMPKRLKDILDKHQNMKQWSLPEDEESKDPLPGDSATKEQMMMAEMVVQRDLLFRKNQIATASSNSIKRECGTDLRRLTSENAALINEMNMLRTENRSLLRSCKEQEANIIALQAKEMMRGREARQEASGGGGVNHAESAPDLQHLGSGNADRAGNPGRQGSIRGAHGPSGAMGGAVASETPYMRRKVVDQQETQRRQRQKGQNQLPPVQGPA